MHALNFYVNFNFQNGNVKKNSNFFELHSILLKCNVSYCFIKFRNIDHDSGGSDSIQYNVTVTTMDVKLIQSVQGREKYGNFV